MRRLLRIAITVADFREDNSALEIRIEEMLRTAKKRDILAMQCGSQITEEDLDFVAQVVDDCVRSAVSRTLGITQTLHF